MSPADDEECRQTAARIDQDFPAWAVVWGTFTRQFVAFPLFGSEPGMIVTAYYPEALVERMRRAEGQSGIPADNEAPDGR